MLAKKSIASKSISSGDVVVARSMCFVQQAIRNNAVWNEAQEIYKRKTNIYENTKMADTCIQTNSSKSNKMSSEYCI